MSKVRCAGCRQYINKGGAVQFGLGWCCDDNCRYEAELRARAHQQRSKPNPNRTTSEPSLARKKEVRRRDGLTCRACGRPGNHVHHINYRSEGGGHEPHNLITLCLACHDTVHADKATWKPLLLAVIWEHYVNGRWLTASQVARWHHLNAC